MHGSNESIVDEEMHVRSSPHDLVQVELFIESRRLIERVMSRRPSVYIPSRAEVQSRSDLLRSDVRVTVEQSSIATTFHQINLA